MRISICYLNFNVSTDAWVFDDTNVDFIMEYVHYTLKLHSNSINDQYFRGTTICHINLESFNNIEYEFPSKEEQESLVPLFDDIRYRRGRLSTLMQKPKMLSIGSFLNWSNRSSKILIMF